jgi:hypothetical protein
MSKRERSTNPLSTHPTAASSNTSRAGQPLTRSTGASNRSTSTNEVPPSQQSSSANSSSIAPISSTGTTNNPSSLLNTDENSNSSTTSNNFEELTRDNDTQGTTNQSSDRDTNIKKTNDSYLQRIKKRPISGVMNSEADAELTW